MGDEAIHARVSAVKEIGHGVASYGRSLTATLSTARAGLNRAGAEFQTAVADSQRRLTAAQRRTEMAAAALARCRKGCEPLQREVAEVRVAEDEARRRHQRNRQAQAKFDRVAAELHTSMRTVQAAAETTVPSGRQHIQEYAEILTGYLKTGVSG